MRSWTRSRRFWPSGNKTRQANVTEAGCSQVALASLGRLSLATNARRFQRQTLRAPGEKQLEIGKLARSRRRHLRADPEQAGADPALQRAHCLPFQLVGRKRIAVALA